MQIQKYTTNSLSVAAILGLIEAGNIAIPEIQRPFVWKKKQVRDLMDSLYKGYPTGYLIIWTNPNVKLKDGSYSSGKQILIDGQQRVTALMTAIAGVPVINSDYKKERIKIAFDPFAANSEDPEAEIFAVQDSSHLKSKRWIPDIAEVFANDFDSFSYITKYCEDNPEMSPSVFSDIITQLKSIGNSMIVTGVPGAGKTLVGLDVAVRQTYQGSDKPVIDEEAVYLSGNGPLVAVLNEALAKDNFEKCRARGESKKITDSRREVGKFIQIIHRYRDNMLAKIKNPVENGILEIDPEKAVKMKDAGFGEVEHVAIFDEAQRSWTHKRLADYLKRGGTYGNKLKVPNFPMSEAAFLIWSLDQREDWATIVCLVGGGQEINTGEAGISEWINALNEQFTHWKVYISPHLTEPEYAEGKVNELLEQNSNVTYADSLHLGVSLRSYRAEKLSAFVHAMLDLDDRAPSIYRDIKDKYPIVLTRDIEKAKRWLHEKVRGTERTGVLITKESARYKPLGIHVLESGDANAVHWFLEDKVDTRSSNYLEDAATEIQVQGLELDYTCLLWDADMRYEDGEWHFYRFNRQTKWIEVLPTSESKQDLMKYMLNAYRVLLTRARAGMVICVPEGNGRKNRSGFWEDSTRLPEYYEGTYQYLKSLGLDEI